MSNTLIIDRVEVCYRTSGKRAYGFLLMDEFECDAVLCFDSPAHVPKTLRGLVEVCREEHYVNALDLLEHCSEEGHLALLDGDAVDLSELTAALAETRDD